MSVPHDNALSCGCVNICISDPDWLILVPSVLDVLLLFAVLHRGSDWINSLYEISTPPCVLWKLGVFLRSPSQLVEISLKLSCFPLGGP